jgi:hypothetical protein
MANEFVNLVTKINSAIRSDKVQRAALSTSFAIHKQRIFAEGMDSKGQKIGTYGTKPISISKDKQARQTGKTYFKGGYSEYKTAVGKNPGFVNLRNTDQMMADYQVIGNASSGFGFGFQNDTNSDKSDWMTDKYEKEIFHASDREVEVFTDAYLYQVNQNL